MFGFFQKKGKASLSPAERLEDCRRRQDYPGLARACYDLGVEAMDRGEREMAYLRLSQASTIFSARDEIYEAMDEALVDDCSERIGQLEDAPLLLNEVLAEIEEKAEELGEDGCWIWSLFALARLSRLGARLAELPGCEALGRLGEATGIALHSFRGELPEEEFQRMDVIYERITEMDNVEEYFGMNGEIPGPEGPFRPFDLEGTGTLTELSLYLEACNSRLDLTREPETGLIPCGLLTGYYCRTVGEGFRDAPQVQAELERIWSDYEFLKAGPSWDGIAARLEAYRELDLLA